ncbi:hypothetical protein LTR91_023299 [Friedmanniomyces endolithicus]|uniref:Uncharacterized protein n=1 Tax=Friedmanniomyces endolithicus TaxID=329885 RepID=A0AAN6JYG8_9PEZI|nr:hypothetical protein LTR94_016454 [Friedmanniomyces endolithicus]KAK0776055.1 hypothetical protein LTR59_014322 [Friedmanniomyces endolithicus]KAK0781321.1 hypothetical protein LTR38_013802 [Friedmanniomyces endolithicus]KAK0836288.1 hypothetical protein LTR03_013812 [Friedmanniomyces endolithicus]KAK0863456.1 hypothetical protein LTS02_006532 [Friedmanniomyces endolithicus]
MVGSQKRATKRPAEGIDDIDHGSKKTKRRRESWGSSQSPSGLLCERRHSAPGCCFSRQGSRSATRRPEDRRASNVSSVSLQLPDGGATMQSLQMPPTKASMNPKIERDVGVDAERSRYNTHRIKRDLSPQTDLTANASELRVALQTLHGLQARGAGGFLRYDFPAGDDEGVLKKCLRLARNNPNLDLDTSHFDWIISALGRRRRETPFHGKDKGIEVDEREYRQSR